MSTILVEQVSKWFGNVVAVNGVTMQIGPGVTGLLGPNGAGKSTLIHMMGGFLPPSAGSVTLDGTPIWRNVEVYRQVGIVPESEGMYEVLSGWDFVLSNARLHGLTDPSSAALQAIATVEMTAAMERDISTYSKGMKQRIKMATALVHNPPVLLLDEPFNGMDPRQRLQLAELIKGMGKQGRTILFSSHILEEVEQVADSIQVMVTGRHAASGDYREIRRLMTERPHIYKVRSGDDRKLASAVVAGGLASGIELYAKPDGSGDGFQVRTGDLVQFTRALPALAAASGTRLYEVSPTDESLEDVFSYLVRR